MRYPLLTGAAPRVAAPATVLAAAAILFAGVPSGLPSADAVPHAHTQGCANGFDCDMASRIDSANSYLDSRPGVTGYVLRDRQTGAVYSSQHAEEMVWTASTIKLAIAEDLLNRARIGAIALGPDDRQLIEQMMSTSNDQATDLLWNKYSGMDGLAFNNAFRANGMTSLTPQPPGSRPNWGFQKATPADLDRLMSNVLDRMHPDDRGYLLDLMRRVDSNQHWGVWGAGAAMRPGLKNGWSEEQGGWVVNSVGFAGPGERYTLAIMTSMNGEGGYQEGSETDSTVAEKLLAGR
ncbi:serine hydrolase [Nocardia sp. NBC_00416]|uniref:serine hydrolase n=1 Tax=Nocardia sp. NBC_00416 TaxID=2975991 RepID=UPI002E234565